MKFGKRGRSGREARPARGAWWWIAAASAFLLAPVSAPSQEIEHAPILYSVTEPRNPVAKMAERMDRGEASLGFEGRHGYLRALLQELAIPESSQVLVFSKTSLQRDRISPRTPRAIYFNDEVMVGFCVRGDVIEIAAADEAVGASFYTIDQEEEETPRPRRQTEACLVCHASSVTQGFPGMLVRSVFADPQGQPLLPRGSFRTDHASPLAERWGGWFVTGSSGRQPHMGNTVVEGAKASDGAGKAVGGELVDARGRLRVGMYPTPHSDIVALMVLEHQVGMLNRLSRAQIETRMAMHYEQEMNRVFARPASEPSESARSRIRSVGDAVARYMLMGGEVPLTDPVAGTSGFAEEFAGRGPRDPQGRSLRDFDLKTRLFRYPCSYLIYSQAFDALPGEVKGYVYERMWGILSGASVKEGDPQIGEEDRRAIVEILRGTKTDLPASWR